jgi:hypothetical protein
MPVKKAITLLPLVLALALPVQAAKTSKTPTSPSRSRQSVGMGCVSPPTGWQVSLQQHEGWASGTIREAASGRFVSFSIGTDAPAASPARIAQFQWLKNEKLNDATLYYGLERKADGHSILEATVVHGAVVANFITPQRGDFDSLPSLLSIARSYSEKCPEATRKK